MLGNMQEKVNANIPFYTMNYCLMTCNFSSDTLSCQNYWKFWGRSV